VYEHDATVGVLLKCIVPASAVVCKLLFCNAFWLSIFCAPPLFDCAYDMDRVSGNVTIVIFQSSMKLNILTICAVA